MIVVSKSHKISARQNISLFILTIFIFSKNNLRMYLLLLILDCKTFDINDDHKSRCGIIRLCVNTIINKKTILKYKNLRNSFI